MVGSAGVERDGRGTTVQKLFGDAESFKVFRYFLDAKTGGKVRASY